MARRTQSAALLAADAVVPETGRMSGEERRRQIIQVAIRLFSQKGFTGTTTKEIALAANVNEALIFRHFATKDDLYTAILDYKANEINTEEWLKELREIAARRDDEGLFRAVAEQKLGHCRRDCEHNFLRLMFYSSLEGHGLAHIFLERQARPVYEFLCDYVAQRQREGAFRKLCPELIVSSFTGMLNHRVMVNAFFKNWKLDMTDEEAAANYTRLLLDGLRKDAGADVFRTAEHKAVKSEKSKQKSASTKRR